MSKQTGERPNPWWWWWWWLR